MKDGPERERGLDRGGGDPGVTQAVQVALLGAMNWARGPRKRPTSRSWARLPGTALALTIQEACWDPSRAARSFRSPRANRRRHALASGALLALGLRGLPLGYAVTGLTAVPLSPGRIVSGSKIGVGLFLAALIAGQLGGGVVLDHSGVVGAATRPVDLIRVVGVVALLTGVVLVRGFRWEIGRDHRVGESSFDRWANVLVDYSTEVATGDQVAISSGVAAEPLLQAIYRARCFARA